jgi:hypothetical protein
VCFTDIVGVRFIKFLDSIKESGNFPAIAILDPHRQTNPIPDVSQQEGIYINNTIAVDSVSWQLSNDGTLQTETRRCAFIPMNYIGFSTEEQI